MQRKLNDEFIREYSEEFSEKITTSFFEEKSKISGKEILSVSPSKQVNFFILKILFRKWQEEMKRLESPFFDYKNGEVKKALIQFMNTLSQHIEVDADHFTPMVEEAVADALLLAADPVSYLTLEFEEMDVPQVNAKVTKPIVKYLKLHKGVLQQFFDENDEMPLDDFLENMEDYFSDTEVEEVLQKELELLSQIVPIGMEDLYRSEEEDLFDEDDDELPGIGDDLMGGDDEIEDEASRSFFDSDTMDDEEEEQTSLFSERRRADDPGDRQPVVEEEVPEEDTYEESSFSEPEGTYEGEQESTEDAPRSRYRFDEADEEAYEPEDDEESEPDAPEEEPEPYTATKLPANEATEEEYEPSVNQQYARPQATLNDRYSEEKEEKTLADKLEQKKVNTIMEAISVNHRYMFTKELFDGDRDAFIEAMDRIQECASFDDAVEMLVQKYAKSLSWDMNSDEVKELLKVVFRKFR